MHKDFSVLGGRVTAVTPQEWIEVLEKGINRGTKLTFVSQNLHSIYLLHRNPILRDAQQGADLVRIDGLPLALWGHFIGTGVRREHRAGFMDLLPLLLKRSVEEQWKLGFVGGKPGVAERACRKLRKRFPGLQIESHHGYFPLEPESGELQSVIDVVNEWEADVLLIGMGMPRQEEFIYKYSKMMNAKAFLSCGAAFDYVAEEVPMAPRWLSSIGLEWLFRLMAQPRVLWKRYLIEPLTLVPLLVSDLKDRLEGRNFEYRR